MEGCRSGVAGGEEGGAGLSAQVGMGRGGGAREHSRAFQSARIEGQCCLGSWQVESPRFTTLGYRFRDSPNSPNAFVNFS